MTTRILNVLCSTAFAWAVLAFWLGWGGYAAWLVWRALAPA